MLQLWQNKSKLLDLFRHAYCIYRLKAWVEEDRDHMVLIPMMRTYLGHQTFNETVYYLRLIADVFPNIRLKFPFLVRLARQNLEIMRPSYFSQQR
jgi:hypothetical protein